MLGDGPQLPQDVLEVDHADQVPLPPPAEPDTKINKKEVIYKKLPLLKHHLLFIDKCNNDLTTL